MNALKTVVIATLVLALLLLGVGFLLPREASTSREIEIAAPPATVFTALNGFGQFNRWSPWASLDPGTVYTYSGPGMGVGAKLVWASTDPGVGSGSQEIIAVEPGRSVEMRLQFAGFDSDNFSRFELEPAAAGSATRLRWTYRSDFRNNPVNRYFGLMLDSLVGPDYERGLAQLKTLVESLPRTDLSGLTVEEVTVAARDIAYLPGRSSTDPAAIGAALGAAYGEVMTALVAAGLRQVGPVMTITRRWDPTAGVYEFEAAIPVDRGDATLATDSPVRLGRSYEGLALKAVWKGPYEGLPGHTERLTTFRTLAGYQDNGAPFDVFVSDPGTTAAAELLTESYWPIKPAGSR